VLGKLSEIASRAKASRNPLVVYYFIGHGGSGGDGWSHVSFVGYYTPSDPADVTRTRAVVETREIKESLEKLDLPYILILDNCYDRETVGAVQAVGQNVGKMWSEAADATARLGLREPAILLYAARPGHSVQTVPHPLGKLYAIGPLARRLFLLLEAAFESKRGLSVGDFLKQMSNPGLDPERPKSVPGDQKAWISNTGAVLIPSGARAKSVESVR
jgi:hypothetical protein